MASIVLLGLGLAGYSAWLLEFFMQTGVSPTEQPVWDLFSAQPVFPVATAIGGLAFLLTGPALMRLAPAHWSGRLTSVSVSAFGIMLMVYAGVPETAVTPNLLSAAVAVGALSLVFWWPSGWRACAVGCLVVVLLAWALVVASKLTGHLEGVFTRVQLVVHSAQVVIGGAYIVQTPVPVRGRKLSVAGAMLRSNRHRK
ncbi:MULTISPECIES: hypothetical protein [Amycolatopsis]|uniref:hypothetical protein n=1 Tax=Amycolatopsis TaxID=1813 RepID=UPI000561DD0C|nr:MULTISPECIES: hypothetical protein [Amycolatopsis]